LKGEMENLQFACDSEKSRQNGDDRGGSPGTSLLRGKRLTNSGNPSPQEVLGRLYERKKHFRRFDLKSFLRENLERRGEGKDRKGSLVS